MGDIKITLVGLEKDLDAPQGRQFPLSLNFSAGSLTNIDARTTDYSLSFRIPATKNNKSALGHFDSTNMSDQDTFLARQDCVVKVDGFPVFTGSFKLLGLVNDRGYEEFNCIILGSGMDWVDGMKNKTLQDYSWGSTLTFDKSSVKTSWSNTYTDGYTFPLVNYGAWNKVNNVTVNDLRPAVFMRALFEKAFAAEGYTIQTDTDSDDFFHTANNPIADKIIFPFTGKNFKDANIVTAQTFNATETAAQEWGAVTSLKYGFVSSGYEIFQGNTRTPNSKSSVLGQFESGTRNSCGRIYINKTLTNNDLNTLSNWENLYLFLEASNGKIKSPTGTVYNIIDYNIISGGTYGTLEYIDFLGQEGVVGQKNIQNVVGADLETPIVVKLAFLNAGWADAQELKISSAPTNPSSIFNTSTYKYTATEAVRAKFKFDAEAYSWDSWGANKGTLTFRIRHKTGSTNSTRGSLTFNPTDTSPIDEYVTKNIIHPFTGTTTDDASVIPVGFESGVIDLAIGDEVWVDVVVEHESPSRANEVLRTGSVGDTITTAFGVKNLEFKSIPEDTIIKGKTSLDVATVLDDRFKVINYIKGCIHAFNLMIRTIPYEKKVIIKTRDNFYDSNSNALDWTSKVDLKKQYVIEYLDMYKRNLEFKFSKDNADGHVAQLSDIKNFELGSYEDNIGARFEDGITDFKNPLFAYTYPIVDRSILATYKGGKTGSQVSGIYMARMWNTYNANSAPPAPFYNFRPRMLVYDYKPQAAENGFKWEGETEVKIPAAMPQDFGTLTLNNFDLNISYGDSKTDGTNTESGLVAKYYQKTISTIEKGTKVSIPMNLTMRDIQTFDITKPIYLEYPAELRGYWIVDGIKGYSPTNVNTTQVELIKKEDFSVRTASTERVVNVEPDGADWSDNSADGQGDRDGAGGISKSDAAHDADETAGRVATDISGSKGFGGKGSGNDGRGGGDNRVPSGSSSKFMTQTSRDEEAENDSREQARKDGWTNAKGVVRAESEDDLNKKPDQEYPADAGNAKSLVMQGEGNSSARGSGNFVTGKGNKATGKNQTVVGQNNKTQQQAVFQVGTGTSDTNRHSALTVGRDGVTREGDGNMVEETSSGIGPVYEEVNGELVKITM